MRGRSLQRRGSASGLDGTDFVSGVEPVDEGDVCDRSRPALAAASPGDVNKFLRTPAADEELREARLRSRCGDPDSRGRIQTDVCAESKAGAGRSPALVQRH